MSERRSIRRTITSLLAFFCLLTLCSCFDPEPASVSVACTFQGLQRTCEVVLESADGKISRRTSTNVRGIGEFKHLLPGDYVMRFVDSRDKAWPAVRNVSVRSGQVLPLRVELTEADAPVPAESES